MAFMRSGARRSSLRRSSALAVAVAASLLMATACGQGGDKVDAAAAKAAAPADAAAPSVAASAATTTTATATAKPTAPAEPAADDGADLGSVDLAPLKAAGGTVYKVKVNHVGSEQFDYGIVQVWLPKGIKQVRGLYLPGVFVNTDPGDGIPKPGGEREALALKFHFGVVTHAFMHRAGTPNNRQAYCGYGSGNGLIRAFKALAKVSKHPELATAPYVMYSYSITNGCATAMAKMFPERMIMMSGGGGDLYDCNDAKVRKIPAIFVGGRYDRATDNWIKQINACRAKGAITAIAMNLNGHEIGDDRPAIKPWWYNVIPRRLPAKVGDPLRPISITDGYLGDHTTFGISKYSSKDPKLKTRSWLPSLEAAKAWQLWQKS